MVVSDGLVVIAVIVGVGVVFLVAGFLFFVRLITPPVTTNPIIKPRIIARESSFTMCRYYHIMI